MKERLARLALCGTLVLAAGAVTACDREDRQDIEEVGNDIERGVDDADSDGKDD